MRAILSKAILATLFFCGGISISHASSPLDGTYSRDWWFIESTSPHQKVVGTDELRIHVIDSSSFKFEVTVTGANAHKCWLSGAANRKGDLFEYHEKLDLSPENYCTLQFQFEKNMVHLNDKFSCKEYCGARAAFVNVTYRAPSLTKKANPPLQETRRKAARP